MDAIELLTNQHREVEDLFEELENATDSGDRQALFEELADNLAIHTAIEERHFYPTVRASETEEILRESAEEHLAAKRTLVDLLDMPPSDEAFDAKLAVLKEQIEHHVKEEEKNLFPKVRKLLDADQLEALGQEMTGTAVEMEEQEPREMLRGQIGAGAGAESLGPS